MIGIIVAKQFVTTRYIVLVKKFPQNILSLSYAITPNKFIIDNIFFGKLLKKNIMIIAKLFIALDV